MKTAIFIITVTACAFEMKAQVRIVDHKADTSILRRYQKGRSEREHYFYTLYSNGQFLPMTKRDSLTVKSLLTRSNSIPNQYSHFSLGYEGFDFLRNRKDSLMLHGYLRDDATLSRQYRYVSMWQDPVQMKLMTKPGNSNYVWPYMDPRPFYYRERVAMPYYTRGNRYEYLTRIKQEERGRP